MKKLSYYVISLFIATSLLFVSCKQNKKTNEKDAVAVEKVAIDEFEVLTAYLEKNGNFINSKTVPAMIKTKEVFENTNNEKYKIIDTRPADLYNEGHIVNAVNVPIKNMLNYFEGDIDPYSYEKIVLVCKSGQSASYATGIMRLMGYENVYAMKSGMSSWGKKFAKDYWIKNISDAYAEKLEIVSNDKPAKGKHPILKTGKTKAEDILRERAQKALNTSYKSLLVKAPALFENPANYYIVNYWPEAKYNAGHIPSAVQYTPKKSLATTTDLYTLPTDKEIVVYCYTGQHAGFVTAYLNMLGYNAKALAYGANSFMNTEMLNKEDDWHAFSTKKIGNYKVVVPELVH